MVFLKTRRLEFRTHQAEDEEAFIQMHTDAQVRRYVGGRAWSAEESVERFRRQFLGRPRRTYGLWAAILIDEDRYIGSCGLIGNRSRPRLAYYIARPFWGQGLATEAAGAFIDAGFSRLGLMRILADVETGNLASDRILQKLGFCLTGSELLKASGRVIQHYELCVGRALGSPKTAEASGGSIKCLK